MSFRRVFYPGVIVSPVGSFALSDLFSGAEAGFAFDYRDLTTLYQDSARTTPCTAAADPINGADDVSGNAHHIGWTSGTVVGGTTGAYYADVTDDFIQLPNATPNPAYFLIILDCPDVQSAIAVNAATVYFAATGSGDTTNIVHSDVGTVTYTVNGNNPTTRDALYTELITGSQPKLLHVDGVTGAWQWKIGGYGGSYNLTAKIYGVICRDTDFSPSEITNVLSYFGAF